MKKVITIIVAVCFMFVSVGLGLAQQGEQRGSPDIKATQGTKPPKAEKDNKAIDKKGECRNPQGVVIPCPNKDDATDKGDKGKPSHKQPVEQKAKGKPVPK